ncbi:MAG: formylglycine-generating enzyme family protein [Acidobacteriota bacterium]|nr:formylglycine-generating enzyme family protein [Acidobacteriota bacterium]MDQ2843666.1 formylglycine-generating enzyme family protein [Acidobacteriota bacterium]
MAVLDLTSNLLLELRSARAESDRLFDILTSDAIYDRPIAQRHRVIFYIGHLDSFDCIQICREGLGMEPVDKNLDALFQFGIDPEPGQLPSDTPADWPTLEKVKSYVTCCRQLVDENLERAPEDVVLMTLEHRQMHLETLAYMFHNFGYDKKKVAEAVPLERTCRLAPLNEWIEIPTGEAVLGKPHDGTFGWDNEFEETRVTVPGFRIQQNSIANGEYLRFIETGAALPHFWSKRGNDIFYRGMFEEVPLPMDWPVYVTESEAEAYAKWIGKSIPTEEQFHRAAYGTFNGEQRPYPWGNAEPTRQHGNFDFCRWDPEPVDATPSGQSAFGVNQLVGNGWQWTSTVFGPLSGFQSRPTYPGYSLNFFDGEHNVIKGGSPRTAARLLRRSFRNWFRRDYAYVYATFRCVEN